MRKRTVKTDGWVNVLTGLGDANYDKRVNATIAFRPMTENEAESLYSSDDIAGKLVDKPAEDAIKNWIEFNKISSETRDELNREMKRLRVKAVLQEAYVNARLHGGAAIIPIMDDYACEDGQIHLEKPLKPKLIKRIYRFIVLNRHELTHSSILVKDSRSRYFGLPVSYLITPRNSRSDLNNVRVHHTRVIRLDGNYLPKKTFQENNYWHDSVLNKTANAIRNYSTGFDAASGLILDYRQGILKTPGVADKITAGKEDEVVARLRIFNLTRSTLNTIMIDKEEEYTQQTFPLTGVGEVLNKIENRMVSAADMPHTVMLGEGGQGGLGNEGKSEKKDYQSKIAQIQETRLTEPLETIIDLIALSADTSQALKVDYSDGFSFDWNSIEQMNDEEEASLRKTIADTDAIYVDREVLTPEEVTISRFGGDDGYSTETVLDPERKEDIIAGEEDESDPDAIQGEEGEAGEAGPEA